MKQVSVHLAYLLGEHFFDCPNRKFLQYPLSFCSPGYLEIWMGTGGLVGVMRLELILEGWGEFRLVERTEQCQVAVAT